MSKGLEVLEHFKYYSAGCRCQYWRGNKCENTVDDCCYMTIGKELKEYEGAKNHIEALHKERVENSLKLKALEIIKSKEINIHALLLHLKRFDSPEGYNMLVGDKYKITQEDFDLLKEVLLW